VLGLIIYVVIFAGSFFVLNRRRTSGKSLPSRTKMLWAMVAVVALAIVVQAVGRH
jgi:hypothetical protein